MLMNASLQLAYVSDFVGKGGVLLKKNKLKKTRVVRVILSSSGHFTHGNGLSSGAAARAGAIIGYESRDDQTN